MSYLKYAAAAATRSTLGWALETGQKTHLPMQANSES